MNRRTSWTAAPAVLAGAVMAATVLMAAVAPRAAQAYVRYTTKSGVPFYWPQSCVHLTAYPADSPDMTPEEIMRAVSAAAGAWSRGQLACTFMDIQPTSSTEPTPAAKFDYYNVLVFRHDSWCKAGDPTMCYDPAALAITSVFVSTADGKIRDGDVEVNARNFVWADADLDPTRGKQDLQNALTHEFGHLIGLDHTCYIPGTVANPPLDNTGTAVPSCDQASEAIRETTMFASAVPGDVSKRTLAPDDQQAVCDIYPVASDPMTCPAEGTPASSNPNGCGCAVGAGAGSPALPVAVLVTGGAFALLAARRSRRRRR